MAKMSNRDLTIQDIKPYFKYQTIYIKQWFKDHITYMVMVVIVIIIAFLIYGQAEVDKQKQINYIYNLKVEIDSLEQTVDY